MFNCHLLYAYGTDSNINQISPYLKEIFKINPKCLVFESGLFCLFLLDNPIECKMIEAMSKKIRVMFVIEEINITNNTGKQYIIAHAEYLGGCELIKSDVLMIMEKYGILKLKEIQKSM